MTRSMAQERAARSTASKMKVEEQNASTQISLLPGRVAGTLFPGSCAKGRNDLGRQQEKPRHTVHCNTVGDGVDHQAS